MLGETADISFIAEFEWFQWVIDYNSTEVYPNAKVVIGGYLGPAINVGTAMTYKILLPNRDYVCRASVCVWTPSEEANPNLLAAPKEYMEHVHDDWGLPV